MPIAATFDLGLKPDDTLREAAGGFKIGPGFLRIDDPDQEPQFISAVDGTFHWNGAARQIEIDTARYIEGGTHISLAGQVAPPVHEGEPWRVGLATNEPGVIAPERKGQVDVAITKGEFAGRLLLDQKTFLIDRLAFQSTQGGLALAGQVDWINGPHIRFGASIDPTPVLVAERLWPSFAAAPVRALGSFPFRGWNADQRDDEDRLRSRGAGKDACGSIAARCRRLARFHPIQGPLAIRRWRSAARS